MADEDLQVGSRSGSAETLTASAERQVRAGGGDGRLLVCATPIGNLADVTLRVLEALQEADLVACEDTRHTRRLLERHGIARGEVVSFHEHNERARAAHLVRLMRDGRTVALVSDAGTPLVSDPGYELVRASIEAGVTVEALPGPSAAVSALVVSGLPTERWSFAGFLPRRGAELRKMLLENAWTLVAFESPKRVAATLATLAHEDPDRGVVVCRELTKLHEEVRRGSAKQLAEYYAAQAPRGEIVLVVAAAQAGDADREQAVAAVRELVDGGARARTAASIVARLTGVGANELYGELIDGEARDASK